MSRPRGGVSAPNIIKCYWATHLAVFQHLRRPPNGWNSRNFVLMHCDNLTTPGAPRPCEKSIWRYCAAKFPLASKASPMISFLFTLLSANSVYMPHLGSDTVGLDLRTLRTLGIGN